MRCQLQHGPSSWIFLTALLTLILNSVFCEKQARAISKSDLLFRLHMRSRVGMYDNPDDYEYEIEEGHPKRDPDKTKRQAGCMCYKHYYDPHCGSDKKLYDNGCYFMCAQQKHPDLKLFRWGTCDAKDDSGAGNVKQPKMVELDFDFDSMDD